jgi:arginine exporter protein ArgO
MIENIYFTGLLLGLLSFLIIGVSHPIVIKLEYYKGKKSWWFLFSIGIFFSITSLFLSDILSIVAGVIGFSFFWSTFEIFKQHERVLKGHAKRNPNRKYE